MLYCIACGALFGNIQQLALHQQVCPCNMPTAMAQPPPPSHVYSVPTATVNQGMAAMNAGAAPAAMLSMAPGANILQEQQLPSWPALWHLQNCAMPAKEIYINEKMSQMVASIVREHEEVRRMREELNRLLTETAEKKKSPQSSDSKSKKDEEKEETRQITHQRPKVQMVPDHLESRERASDSVSFAASVSTLRADVYSLTLDHVEGVDIQVPLTDIIVGVDEYHLLEGLNQQLLENIRRKHFFGRDITKVSPTQFVISVKEPLEFSVKHSNDLHVFIFTFTCRTRVLFWASLCARQEGMWMIVLRRPPVDVSTCLELTDDCIPNTMIRGTIQSDHTEDVLTEAEKYLRQATAVRCQHPGEEVACNKISSAAPAAISSSAAPAATSSSAPAPSLPTPTQSTAAQSTPAQPQLAQPEKELREIPVNMDFVSKLHYKLEFDKNGNPIVPANYKSPSDSPLRIASPAPDAGMDASVMLQARTEDALLPTAESAGHGPSNNQVDMHVGFVSSLPVNAASSRLLVYLINNIDPTTGQEVNHAENPEVLLRPPDAVHYETGKDGPLFAKFDFLMKEIVVTERTHAIVIIEYVTLEEELYVFGCVALPINSSSMKGNFVSRIRLGDPRRPEGRLNRYGITVATEREAMKNYSQMEIEDALNSQALYNSLFSPPIARHVCCPCGYIMWSLESEDLSAYFDFPNEPKPSMAEQKLCVCRQQLDPEKFPFFDTQEEIMEAFQKPSKPMHNKMNYILPCAPERFFYVDIESLHCMGNDPALYSVVIDFGADDPDGVVQTLQRNWSSDVGAPHFNESLRLLNAEGYDENCVAIIYLFKITNLNSLNAGQGEGSGVKLEVVGWTMIKLFLEKNTLRHGRFALPWFEGVPPDKFLEELELEPLERVFVSWLSRKKLQFLQPFATLVLSLSEPADVEQITLEHPGRPLPQKLYIPVSQKEMFPSGKYEGAIGFSQKQFMDALRLDTGRVEQFINESVKKHVGDMLFE